MCEVAVNNNLIPMRRSSDASKGTRAWTKMTINSRSLYTRFLQNGVSRHSFCDKNCIEIIPDVRATYVIDSQPGSGRTRVIIDEITGPALSAGSRILFCAPSKYVTLMTSDRIRRHLETIGMLNRTISDQFNNTKGFSEPQQPIPADVTVCYPEGLGILRTDAYAPRYDVVVFDDARKIIDATDDHGIETFKSLLDRAKVAVLSVSEIDPLVTSMINRYRPLDARVTWYHNEYRATQISWCDIDAKSLAKRTQRLMIDDPRRRDAKGSSPNQRFPVLFVGSAVEMEAMHKRLCSAYAGGPFERFAAWLHNQDSPTPRSICITERSVLPPASWEFSDRKRKSCIQYTRAIAFLKNPSAVIRECDYVFLSIPGLDLSDRGVPMFEAVYALSEPKADAAITDLVAAARGVRRSIGLNRVYRVVVRNCTEQSVPYTLSTT